MVVPSEGFHRIGLHVASTVLQTSERPLMWTPASALPERAALCLFRQVESYGLVTKTYTVNFGVAYKFGP